MAIVPASGQPYMTSSTAATPPSRPSNEPTDRSISPETMTNTIAEASMPVIAICRSRLEKLRAVRNCDVPLVRSRTS